MALEAEINTHSHSRAAIPIRLAAFVEATHVNGAVKPLLGFAETLRDEHRTSECSVTLIGFQRLTGPGGNPLAAEAEQLGISFRIVPERRAYDPSILGSIRAHIDALKPDILQTNASKSHFLVRLLGLHRRSRWVAFHHGYTRLDRKNLLLNQLDRWSLRAAHRVITVCEAFIPEIESCGVPRERIRVQHNPVRAHVRAGEDVQRELRTRHGISPDNRVLLTVGRLSAEKGHIYLIEAAAKLCREGGLPPFTVILAGDGPERQALVARSKELGVDSVVRFAGHQNPVMPWYDISDVFVLPSLSEGSPNVLLEALSAGLPVVASRVGGIPEIVESGRHAVLTRAGNAGELAAAIRSVLCDAGMRAALQHEAMVRAADFYPSLYTNAVLSQFQEVLHGR